MRGSLKNGFTSDCLRILGKDILPLTSHRKEGRGTEQDGKNLQVICNHPGQAKDSSHVRTEQNLNSLGTYPNEIIPQPLVYMGGLRSNKDFLKVSITKNIQNQTKKEC